MPRAPRLDAPGTWHHVMNRGARREPIFHSDDHCLLLLTCIEEACVRYGIEVHAWVFMTNHYHLLVRSVRGNLSDAMKLLAGRYAQQLNRLHGWDGPVFRGRYRSQVLADEGHLRAVVPYIHLNPCRAGLVIHPEDAHWSSAAAYAGLSTPEPFLVRDEVLAIFGSREELLRETEALRTARTPWAQDLDLKTGFFIGRSARTEEERNRHPGGVQPIAHVIRLVEEIAGAPWSEIMQPRMGRGGNPNRRLAVWALQRYAGLRHQDIARHLDTTPGAVSHTLLRLRSGKEAARVREWEERFHGREKV